MTMDIEVVETYFQSIVQWRNGKYVIEYGGRRYTSRRRRALRRTLARLLARTEPAYAG